MVAAAAAAAVYLGLGCSENLECLHATDRK